MSKFLPAAVLVSTGFRKSRSDQEADQCTLSGSAKPTVRHHPHATRRVPPRLKEQPRQALLVGGRGREPTPQCFVKPDAQFTKR
jgi:hypothetical protein